MNINEQIIKNFSEKFNFIDESVVPNKYVFIGGTALMLLSMDADFEEIRGTKDYDIVLLVKDSEGNKELFKKMWEYIEEGEYDVFQTKEGTTQYYRFTNPSNKREYPEQLEFFSNAPDFINGREERFTPLHVDDDIQSLSSIIMNDIYYDFILTQCRIVQNVNSVTELGLMALKARAYNDLSERKKEDPRIASKNIDKHKKDIIRVLEFIAPDNICDLNEYPEIQDDIKIFIKNLEEIYSEDESIRVGDINTKIDDIRTGLKQHFSIN